MRRHRGLATIVLLVGALLTACASGAVTGRVVRPGQADAPLTMTWRSGIFGEQGKISAVMPDGEQFAGTYTVVSKGSSWAYVDPAWRGTDSELTRGEIDGSMWGAASAENPDAFIAAHLNKAIATLRGDRGSTMLCRFHLAAGEAGMGGGGTGECQTSKGARITARF